MFWAIVVGYVVIRDGPKFCTGFSILLVKGFLGPHPSQIKSPFKPVLKIGPTLR